MAMTSTDKGETNSRWSIGVLLFDEFELLDVFGPLEMYGMLPGSFEICMVAENSGQIASRQGPKSIADCDFNSKRQFDILLVPGGSGTRREVDNQVMLDWLQNQSMGAEYVTAVCTGSALLARAGILDGRKATTNKRAYDWATSQSDKVHWIKQARWVEDGKFFTSSGVSAGMDMSLGLIARLSGEDAAEQVATWTEYEWHRDPEWDPFAKVYGLI